MVLDTSGLFSYLNPRDAHHPRAVALFDQAISRWTHCYVLDELVALCEARRINRITALNFSQELVQATEVEVVWVDHSLHREALDLLRHRLDKSYSLCDAVSFVLMRRRNEREALTTDGHFDQEGFVRLLR